MLVRFYYSLNIIKEVFEMPAVLNSFSVDVFFFSRTWVTHFVQQNDMRYNIGVNVKRIPKLNHVNFSVDYRVFGLKKKKSIYIIGQYMSYVCSIFNWKLQKCALTVTNVWQQIFQTCLFTPVDFPVAYHLP